MLNSLYFFFYYFYFMFWRHVAGSSQIATLTINVFSSTSMNFILRVCAREFLHVIDHTKNILSDVSSLEGIELHASIVHFLFVILVHLLATTTHILLHESLSFYFLSSAISEMTVSKDPLRIRILKNKFCIKTRKIGECSCNSKP